MQGCLNEIDLRSILQLISLGQRTGVLSIRSYRPNPFECSNYVTNGGSFLNSSYLASAKSSELFWFVFFVNGQIVYAYNERNSNLFRLQDYLHRYKLETTTDKELASLAIDCTNPPEYAYLWFLLEKKLLTPVQARNILQNLVQETLFDLFNLYRGNFIFQNYSPLAPQPIALELAPLVNAIPKQIQQWKQFQPQIYSPEQRPAITDPTSLQKNLPENAYASLSRWSDGQKNLRQLSRYLNRDILTTAKAIYPLVKKGWMKLLDPLPDETFALAEELSLANKTDRVARIVYIGNDLNLDRSVEQFLQTSDYQKTIITNPLQAMGQLLEIEPDLILCELNLPQIDGCALCAMLRNSNILRDIPLIVLATEERFLDRLKAQTVGATEYLAKPVTEKELSILVKKYLTESNKSSAGERITDRTLLPK